MDDFKKITIILNKYSKKGTKKADTNISYAESNYDIRFEYRNINLVHIEIKTKINILQEFTYKIILKSGTDYPPSMLYENPIEFYHYLCGIGDILVNQFFNYMSLDHYKFVVRNKKLDIINSDSYLENINVSADFSEDV